MAIMTQVGLEFIARNRANQKISAFNRSIRNLGRQMLMIAGVGGGLYGLKRGFEAVIKSASDAQEITAKFNVVFGELSLLAHEWAEDFGNSVGRATQDVEQWMSGLQDTFVPLGIARAEAAELSKSLVTLAVDVASFNNAADATVIRDFTSALVGNHETVRKYGIIISESALKQEALREGLNKTYSQLTDLEKVQLRYSLIQKGTTDAQGDAIRTTDSYANQVKRLSANFTELKTIIGDDLIPVLADFFNEINKNWETLVKLANVISPLLLMRKNIKALTPEPVKKVSFPKKYVPSWEEQMGLDIIEREEPFFKKLQAMVKLKEMAGQFLAPMEYETDEFKPSAARKRMMALQQQVDMEIALMGRLSEPRQHARMWWQYMQEALKEYGGDMARAEKATELFRAKLKELEQAERLARIAEDIGDSFANAFEDAIFEAKKFGDIINSLLRDIARSVVRNLITQPLGMGISFGIGRLLGITPEAAGAPSVFTSPHGGPGFPSAQYGGDVLKTGLAVIHKGETFSGVNNKGGDVIINLYYQGMPMGIDKYEQRRLEDKRIIDVWASNVAAGGTARRVIREEIANVE